MGGLEMCTICLNKQLKEDSGAYQFQVFNKIPFFGALKDYRKLLNGSIGQQGGKFLKKIGNLISPSAPTSPFPQVFDRPAKLMNLKPIESIKSVGSSIFELVGDQSFVKKIKKSKYSQIVASLQATGQKFTDFQFPADEKSLGKLPSLELSKIKWLRVNEMLQSPVFIHQRISPDDILQGSLGDCYFLSAMASLAEQDYRIKNILASLEVSGNGIYMARVLHNGVYQQVVVDDYLPANQKNEPLFAKPAGKRGIWVMVLEKCWAKLFGSYANIVGGLPHEVSHAFSSAPVFLRRLPGDDKKREALWNEMLEDERNGALFCCGTTGEDSIEKLGFVKGHAYSILGIYEKPFRLVKVRNPWGHKEWRGIASDHDLDFWNQVSAADKQALDYHDSKRNKDKDGVFFILWQDFLQYFSIVDICKINDNASYNFLEAEFEHLGGRLFQFQVRGAEATVTFAATQPSRRASSLAYSRSYLALGKWDDSSKCYKYVKSASNNSFPDNYLEVKQATAGKYVLYAKFLWNTGAAGRAVISAYSVSPAQLVQSKGELLYQNFLKDIFYDRACRNPRKQVINGTGDWLSSEILLNQGGFSYFAVNVSKESKAKLGVTLTESQYVERKLQLLPSLKGCQVLKEEVTASKPFIAIAQLLVSAFPQKISNLPQKLPPWNDQHQIFIQSSLLTFRQALTLSLGSNIRGRQQFQQMGLQSDDYHYVFKTMVISWAKSFAQFEKSFLSSQEACCDLFLSNIFAASALHADSIDLDECFVPSHQTFTAKQLPHLTPLLNGQLLAGDIPNRAEKLAFVASYCVYLGLKRVAVRLDLSCLEETIESLWKIAKTLNKAKIAVIVIVSHEAAEQVDHLWNAFVIFRQGLAKSKLHIELCLQFQAALTDQKPVEKWLAENVRHVSFKSTAFLINHKGFPVLSTHAEMCLKRLIKTHCDLALSQHQPTDTATKSAHFKYYGFLVNKVVQSKMSDRQWQAQRLLDYLQSPLQPYIDNLDAEVYDIFEKDSHKYNQYEIAFLQVFSQFKADRPLVAYYVGCGKGLILQKLMSACKARRSKVKVYCIEKNPFPLQSLKRRIQKNKWVKFVEIVLADIKHYVMPEAPDLVFSELLGGIGDNQLSPQCLRWAQKNATAATKWVPQSYQTFIRPISAHALYQQLSEQDKQGYFTVNLGQFYSPFQSQQIWQFSHPLSQQDDLTRKAAAVWQAEQDLVLHGFEGTFDCNLYGKAYFSIAPENRDKDFYSWFPLYFAFTQEERLQKGQRLAIEVQRNSNDQQVWYQWRYTIESGQKVALRASGWHNHNGKTAIELISNE